MKYNKVILEKKGGVARIVLNRPEALNCVDGDSLLQLEAALTEVEDDNSIKVVVITGKGRAFCAGADLKYLKGMMQTPESMYEFLSRVQRIFNLVDNLSKPVIASINGLALAGGLELVSACDLAIASEEARLGDQHANYGLVAGGGGTQRIARIIGPRKAKELILTGDSISGKEAERIGLVNRAVPSDKLEDAVNEIADKLANKSAAASKVAKTLINRGLQTDLYTALMLETEACTRHATTSEDVREGLQAFEEKRSPVFK